MTNKKLILTGPHNSGKTTIKRIFFEGANPIKLLQYSLKPTRGINSSVYSLFNEKLGVFDLAGQENENWFNKDKDVFRHASVIICIFEVKNSLKLIVDFILNLMKVKKTLHLTDSEVIIFLHKIDLVSESYVYEKIKAIKSFFRIRHPKLLKIKIFKTSVVEDSFFDTFNVIYDILNLLFKKDLIQIDNKEFTSLKHELSILLKSDVHVKYSKHDLANKFNMTFPEVERHLKRLKVLGFVTFFKEEPLFFQLTNRALYFKRGIFKEKSKVDQLRKNKGLQLIHAFSNLQK
ncbi:MAG: ADP-ribosylation factor-like protein [archaeon]